MMVQRTRCLAAVFLIALSACVGGSVESWMTPAQRTAVDDFLRDHPNAELVEPSECTNPDLQKYRSEHGNYNPYFAEEDFNGDGSLDFVVATKIAGAYDLWLFLGSGTGYRNPQNFATLTWLHEGGLILRDKRLYVGAFYGEDGNTYSWDARARRFAVYSPESP